MVINDAKEKSLEPARWNRLLVLKRAENNNSSTPDHKGDILLKTFITPSVMTNFQIPFPIYLFLQIRILPLGPGTDLRVIVLV